MMKKAITIVIIIVVVIAISIITVEQSMNQKETLPSSNIPSNTLQTTSTGKVIKLNLPESVRLGAH